MGMSAATIIYTADQSIVTTAPGSVLQWSNGTYANRAGTVEQYRYILKQSGYYLINLVFFTSIAINCRAFLTNQSNTSVAGGRVCEMISNSNSNGIAVQTFGFSTTYYLPKDYPLGINVLPSANCTVQYRLDSQTFAGPKLQVVQLTGAINY